MATSAAKKVVQGPVLGFDEKFGQRLCGEEPYHPEGTGDGFVDERFGGLVSESQVRLRDALPKMVEEGGRDPEIARLLREAGIENPAVPSTVRVCGQPFAVFFNKGSWRATGTLAGMKYQLSAESRDGVLDKLIHLGQRVQEESIHQLTESERLQVVRLSQAGDVTGAISLFCELAIGHERASQYASPNEMLADSALAEVFDEAALVTWFASHSNVQDSDEWNAFLQNYAGGRPYTHQLLDGAWNSFKEEQYRHTPLLPRKKEEPPTPREIVAGLEEMSDEQINKQFWTTARHVARSGR
jgi:hypothetical protein